MGVVTRFSDKGANWLNLLAAVVSRACDWLKVRGQRLVMTVAVMKSGLMKSEVTGSVSPGRYATLGSVQLGEKT